MENIKWINTLFLIETIYGMIVLAVLMTKIFIYLTYNLLDNPKLNLRLLGNIALICSTLLYFTVNISMYLNFIGIRSVNIIITMSHVFVVCCWDFITLLLIRLWLNLFFQVSYEKYNKLRIYLVAQIILEIIFVFNYIVFVIIGSPFAIVFNIVIVVLIFVNGTILIYLVVRFRNYSNSTLIESVAGSALKSVGKNIIKIFALLSVGFIFVMDDAIVGVFYPNSDIRTVKLIIEYAISLSTNCIGLFIVAKTINFKTSNKTTPVSSLDTKQITIMVTTNS